MIREEGFLECKWYKRYYTKVLSVLITLVNIGNLFVGGFLVLLILSSIGSLFNRQVYVGDHKIVSRQILDDKKSCDPLTVKLEECVIDDKGNIYIRYTSYMKTFSHGWSMLNFNILDELRNTYYGGASSYGSILGTYHQITIDTIHPDAKKLILEYDHYNRYMRFEINLEEVKGDV